MLNWFELHRKSGLLDVTHNAVTWRANQAIATFSDMLFPSTFAFEPTVSNQEGATDHDGVFAVAEADVAAYVERFRSEEHTSELQSLMRISYAVFCLQKK